MPSFIASPEYNRASTPKIPKVGYRFPIAHRESRHLITVFICTSPLFEVPDIWSHEALDRSDDLIRRHVFCFGLRSAWTHEIIPASFFIESHRSIQTLARSSHAARQYLLFAFCMVRQVDLISWIDKPIWSNSDPTAWFAYSR